MNLKANYETMAAIKVLLESMGHASDVNFTWR
jgi:hypothetical protein